MVCCSCNRIRGSCKGYACVKASRPCLDCQPSSIGACQNTQSRFRTSSSPANPDNIDHVSGSAIFVNSHSSDSVSTAFHPDGKPVLCVDNLDGPSFTSLIHSCYDEVVHWRMNILSGKAGTSFVRELARLYKSYADSSALESVALYAVM